MIDRETQLFVTDILSLEERLCKNFQILTVEHPNAESLEFERAAVKCADHVAEINGMAIKLIHAKKL